MVFIDFARFRRVLFCGFDSHPPTRSHLPRTAGEVPNRLKDVPPKLPEESVMARVGGWVGGGMPELWPTAGGMPLVGEERALTGQAVGGGWLVGVGSGRQRA